MSNDFPPGMKVRIDSQLSAFNQRTGAIVEITESDDGYELTANERYVRFDATPSWSPSVFIFGIHEMRPLGH